MNDVIRVTCAECGATLKGSTKLLGQTVKCPKCKSPLKVEAQPPVAAASDPLAADPLMAEPLEADPLAVDAQSVEPAVEAPTSQVCPHCHARVPVAATKCRHCGEFIAAASASRSGAALPESAAKMHPVEYAMAVLLAPVALGIGMVWAIQKFPKARTMLLISVPMTALFAAAFLSYFVFRPGAVSEAPPIDDLEGPMAGNWENSDGSWSTPDSPSGQNRDEPSIVKPPTEEDLNNQPPQIQRAMRANVRLIVANRMLGSGVVVEMTDEVVKILTNRHVIDEAFADSDGTQETPLDSLTTVDVTYVTGDKEPGKVIWVAPDGIDLAVVRAVCPADGVLAATWSDSTSVGEDVFAVGNPAGLGWSLTKGTVSALRSHETKNKKATIPVIQTDAPITHGNSGGGLYNGQGDLIGINNFIINPRLANNAGFAIRFSLLNKWNDVPFDISGQPRSEAEVPEAASTGG